ncbi:Hypothetical protein NTJ_15799 [Nesidiocoris tenuis]|uniref:Uncharacterized protein n=1 Tax=Nesidiocoris tenuis TaxID=355587 RepID=A0ABN7BF34_9HEMI|nr:Hypothetical protein NTJ_15799 [Nesidiocoris tenuis]
MATLHLSSNLPLFGYREQSEVPLARDHVRSRSDQSTDDNPAHASRTTSTKKGRRTYFVSELKIPRSSYGRMPNDCFVNAKDLEKKHSRQVKGIYRRTVFAIW